MRTVFLAGAAFLALTAGFATAAEIRPVASVLETPNLTDDDGDADDPSFWVDPTDASRSLVIVAIKNGGIRVYDLKGVEIQAVKRVKTDAGKGRINNIDVVYGFKFADGSLADLAVASDRGLDVIRVYKIDRSAENPLTEITDLSVGRAFPKRPDAAGADVENPLEDQNTVYGITAFRAKDGSVLAVGNQRHQPVVGVFGLEATSDGKVAVRFLRDIRVPTTFAGQDLTVENEADPRKDWSPQFEGIVADKTTGIVYGGQEDVGIWTLDPLKGAVIGAGPVYTTRGSTESSFNKPESVISRDVEGLSIYYGANQRYLLASSQGGAHGENPAADAPYDDSFAVFRIDGAAPALVGSFHVATTGGIDAVQESDGADVIATALPGFPNGLFVTQDGYNDDLNGLDGKTKATNFKFVDWSVIANSFQPPLEINPSYDPRK